MTARSGERRRESGNSTAVRPQPPGLSLPALSCRFAGAVKGQAIVLLVLLLMSFSIPAPAAGAGSDSLPLRLPESGIGYEGTKDTRPAGLHLDEPYLKGYLADAGKMVNSPRYWDAGDWSAAALVLSLSAGLYAYDQDLKEWFQARRSGTTDDLAGVFSPFGNPFAILPVLGFAYYYGETRGSEKAKRIGLLGAESVILAGAFTGFIKFAGHRRRPDRGDGYDRWDGPGFSTDNLSFPSEHASAAFSLATVIASESENAYVAPAAYGIASLVVLSRLNDNEHWSSDAFLGAALGYFTGRAVLRLHANKAKHFVLLPQVTGERYGLMMSLGF